MTEVVVQDGESIEAALKRFKREVMKAGIIIEVKQRKHYESPHQKKKRVKKENKRRATGFRKPESSNSSSSNSSSNNNQK